MYYGHGIMDCTFGQHVSKNGMPLVFWHQLQFLAFSLQMLFSLLLLDVIQVNDMEYVLDCFVDLE